jgi:hypothetical protein
VLIEPFTSRTYAVATLPSGPLSASYTTSWDATLARCGYFLDPRVSGLHRGREWLGGGRPCRSAESSCCQAHKRAEMGQGACWRPRSQLGRSAAHWHGRAGRRKASQQVSPLAPRVRAARRVICRSQDLSTASVFFPADQRGCDRESLPCSLGLFTDMRVIFTLVYPVSNPTGSDGRHAFRI